MSTHIYHIKSSADSQRAPEENALPLGTNSINFVNEDDTWSVFLSHPEELPNKLGSVAQVLLDKFRTNNPQERGRGLVRDSLRKQSLARPRDAIQNDTFGWFDAHLFVQFWMGERELDRFLNEVTMNKYSIDAIVSSHLDLLYLLFETTDVRITLSRGFIQLHYVHHRVCIVREYANDRVCLVVQQDCASRFE